MEVRVFGAQMVEVAIRADGGRAGRCAGGRARRLTPGKHPAVSDEAETTEAADAHELSPSAAAELIEAGAELIDVRQPSEFEAGGLRGRATSS